VVISPFFELTGQCPMQAVDLGFYSRVSGDLPLPPQPILESYNPVCQPISGTGDSY